MSGGVKRDHIRYELLPVEFVSHQTRAASVYETLNYRGTLLDQMGLIREMLNPLYSWLANLNWNCLLSQFAIYSWLQLYQSGEIEQEITWLTVELVWQRDLITNSVKCYQINYKLMDRIRTAELKTKKKNPDTEHFEALNHHR